MSEYTGVVTYGDTDGTYAGTGWLNYDDLIDAYNACPEGGAVLIAPGTHQPSVEVSVNKRVDFIGDPVDMPIVYDPGGGTAATKYPVFQFVSGSDCLIEGIEFRSSNDQRENGVVRWRDNPEVRIQFNGCRFVARGTNVGILLDGHAGDTAWPAFESHPPVLFDHCEFYAPPGAYLFRWIYRNLIRLRSSVVDGSLDRGDTAVAFGVWAETDYVEAPDSEYGCSSATTKAKPPIVVPVNGRAIGTRVQPASAVLFYWNRPEAYQRVPVQAQGEWSAKIGRGVQFGVYYREPSGAFSPVVHGPYTAENEIS